MPPTLLIVEAYYPRRYYVMRWLYAWYLRVRVGTLTLSADDALARYARHLAAHPPSIRPLRGRS